MDYVSSNFFGMRSSEEWAEDQLVKNLRAMIMMMYPNGDAPLTAIKSVSEVVPTPTPEYSWLTQRLAGHGGTFTELYTDVALSSAYTSGGSENDILYCKMGATVTEGSADIYEFLEGQIVTFRYYNAAGGDSRADTVAEVVDDPVANGASSYIKVKLLEDDRGENDANCSFDLSDCNEVWVTGTASGEGSDPIEATNRIPTKIFNYTQIFQNTLELTGTALATKIETGDPLNQEEREKLLDHGMDIEWAGLYGIRKTMTDSKTNKEKRLTGGFDWMLRNYASSNRFLLHRDSSYSSQAWLNYGDDALLDAMESLYRWNKGTDYFVLLGSGAQKGLTQLARANRISNDFEGQTIDYGFQLNRWVNDFGTCYTHISPLMSRHASLRNTMLFLKPEDIHFRPLVGNGENRDTKLKDVTTTGKDGVKEQYITEGGWEFHNIERMGWIEGVGLANVV